MPTLTGDGLTQMTREQLIRECRNKQAVINHLNEVLDAKRPNIAAICELDGCCMLRDKTGPQEEKS
jgi:hypothetical protein